MGNENCNVNLRAIVEYRVPMVSKTIKTICNDSFIITKSYEKTCESNN